MLRGTAVTPDLLLRPARVSRLSSPPALSPPLDLGVNQLPACAKGCLSGSESSKNSQRQARPLLVVMALPYWALGGGVAVLGLIETGRLVRVLGCQLTQLRPCPRILPAREVNLCRVVRTNRWYQQLVPRRYV